MKWKTAAALLLAGVLGVLLQAQTFTPLTPWSNLRGKTDSNGAVLAIGSAVGAGQSTPLTPFPNLLTRTDSNGALNVAISGGTATFTAGSGGSSGATYKPSGVIQRLMAQAANTSTTNYLCVPFTAIPANTLVNNGDQIHVRVWWHSAANATNKNVWIRWNYTSCANDATGFTGGTTVETNTTSTSSANIITDGYIWRTGLNAQATTGFQNVSGSGQSTAPATAAATETSAINLGLAFQNTTASDATIDLVYVEFIAAN